MAELKFSTNEALRFGWETMKNNFVFFVILFLIMFFISAIPSALNAMMENLTREKTRHLIWRPFSFSSSVLVFRPCR